VDNAGNDAFTGTGLSVWPVSTVFSVDIADSALPTAQATNPADNSTQTPGTLDITGTAFDADSGVNRVRVRVQRLDLSPKLYWNGTAWTPTSTYPDADLNDTDTTWTLPSVDLTNTGNYRIHYIVNDNAGNIARVADNPASNFSVN